MTDPCPECGETKHTRTCKRGEINDYRPPKRVKHYHITAAVDGECRIGQRRENREKLKP